MDQMPNLSGPVASQSSEDRSRPTAPPQNAPESQEPQKQPMKPYDALQQERRLVQMRQQQKKEYEDFQNQRKAFEAERERYKKLEEDSNRFNSLREKAKTSPKSAFDELGLDYSSLTRQMLDGGEKDSKYDPRLDEFSKRFDKFDQYFEQQQQERQQAMEREKQQIEQQRQQEQERFSQEIHSFLDQKKDEYELINVFGQKDLVRSTIEAHYETNGEVLSPDDAAKMVENHLAEMAEKYIQTKRFQSRFRAIEQDQNPSSNDTDPDQDFLKNARTLTNDLASNPNTQRRAASEQDRIERAIAAMQRVG